MRNLAHQAVLLVALPAIAGPTVIHVTSLAPTHIQGLNFMCNCHILHITVTKGTNFLDIFDRKIPIKHKPL